MISCVVKACVLTSLGLAYFTCTLKMLAKQKGVKRAECGIGRLPWWRAEVWENVWSKVWEDLSFILRDQKRQQVKEYPAPLIVWQEQENWNADSWIQTGRVWQSYQASYSLNWQRRTSRPFPHTCWQGQRKDWRRPQDVREPLIGMRRVQPGWCGDGVGERVWPGTMQAVWGSAHGSGRQAPISDQSDPGRFSKCPCRLMRRWWRSFPRLWC